MSKNFDFEVRRGSGGSVDDAVFGRPLAQRQLDSLRARLEQAERERDEARALLREIRKHPNDPARRLKIDEYLRGESDE